VIRPGRDAVILSAGPVMLGESMAAAALLAAQGIEVEVRNHPWLTEFDADTIRQLSARNIPVVVVEDHYHRGGLGEGFFAAVAAAGKQLAACGHVAVEDLPDTGFRQEALVGMKIDRQTIAARVAELLGANRRAAA
jgi:transketolase